MNNDTLPKELVDGVLFCSMHQIINDKQLGHGDFKFPPDLQFDLKPDVVIRRNSGGNVSYITVEFANPNGQAKHHVCMSFGGGGNYDTDLHQCVIPRIKPAATRLQRALAYLSLMKFLIENEHFEADLTWFDNQADEDWVAMTQQKDLLDRLIQIEGNAVNFVKSRLSNKS